MLDTDKFIKDLISYGYTHLCTVPCSFAKNLINASINYSDQLEYLPCASEAVACSVAAGLKLSGKKPIVIVQSSGLTNMGSCITSLLKPYKIFFPIIVSWRTYGEGDSEIQHQHLAANLPNLIEAYGYKPVTLNKDEVGKAIMQIEHCDHQNTICLLEAETFSPVSLSPDNQLDLSDYPKRSEYLKVLDSVFNDTNELFIGTTGNTAREMYHFMPRTSNFYMAGNMGGALSVGFGAAKAGKKVTVCGGDAEFVMHLGGLTTAGRYNNINLTYIVFDNKSNKSTGGQNSYQKHVDYLNLARACGVNSTFDINSVSEFEVCIEKIKELNEVSVTRVSCSYDPMSPRPDKEVIQGSKKIFLSSV
tara:strand:- start:260 stop:1342 length:1083 start_codon:yes stop_codon:yes gene_type:complete